MRAVGQRSQPAHKKLRASMALTVAISVVAVSGSLLELTVAPRPQTPQLKGIALAGDPSSGYNTALGGNASALIDWYEVSASLPKFVGDPSYKGEQLLMWFFYDVPLLLEPVGIFHEGYDSLGFGLPILTPSDEHELAIRRPAEILLLGLTSRGFESALRDLGPYQPVLVRTTVLERGSAVLHASLIVLRTFAPRSVWPSEPSLGRLAG
jgi:hypothetical protein